MNRLEKLALASAAIGAVFNVFLFAIGSTLSDATQGSLLFYVRVFAGILQAASFDLVAVATVLGTRAGRRSKWSMITAWTAAAVSALIALDVSGVWSQPWLHAANSLIVLAFMLHLSAPRKTQRIQQVRRLVKRLIKAVRIERKTMIGLSVSMQQLQDRVTGLSKELLERDRQLLVTQTQLVDYDRRLVDAQTQLSRMPEPKRIEVIRVVAYEFEWGQFEKLVMALTEEMTERRLSQSTIRRRVAALAEPVTEA